MPVFLPRSLDECFEALDRFPEAELLAGGTDFMVELNAGRRRPSAVISIRAIPELRGWYPDGREIALRAGLTYTEMMAPDIAGLVPGLAQAARTVGSPQIRNAGTLGGNIATASPAGDTLPVLAALDAAVVVGSPTTAPRTVALEEVITGPKLTSLQPGELVLEVRVPAACGTQEFLKVGTRNAMVIAVASSAVVVDFDARRVLIALGSVGPVVIRAREAETAAASLIDWDEHRLVGSPRDRGDFGEAVRAASQPIDDHRSTAAYRRHAVGICAERALVRAVRDHSEEAA